MAAQPGLLAFRKMIHIHTSTNTHSTSEMMVGMIETAAGVLL